MTRATVALALVCFIGTVLLLSELRRVRRPRLAERLAPYGPPTLRPTRGGVMSVTSFREVISPLARSVGERASRLFGVGEQVELRLRRTHASVDVTVFRVRQLGWSAAAFGLGAVLSVGIGAAPPLAFLFTFGSPILVFLAIEQHLAAASAAWQRRIFLELPVVVEQLGMLMSAGWSVGAAIQRIAHRGRGACATDLRRVALRMRQGLTEIEALREWSAVARVDALDRLVAVLGLNREAADLDRLIGQEARTIRRDAQRELIEAIEKRSQQVWIPVTIAALIPGVLLMGVPFVDALTLFSA